MTEKPALPPELRSWREHVCAWQTSDQTMVAYAKAHRLSVQAFYRAKARLARYGADRLPPPGSLFQRVDMVSDSLLLSSCRVHLPNGVVVELGVEDAGLDRVLQAAGALS